VNTTETSYSLVNIIATIEWTRLEYRVYRLQLATKFVSSSIYSPANTGPQTTKLFDFTSNTTLHTAGERMYEDWRARYFQVFSAFPGQRCDRTGRTYVLNDSVFDIGLIALQLFYMHQVVLLLGKNFQSSWPHYEVNLITNVEKSASSAGILAVQWASPLDCYRYIILNGPFKVEFIVQSWPYRACSQFRRFWHQLTLIVENRGRPKWISDNVNNFCDVCLVEWMNTIWVTLSQKLLQGHCTETVVKV